MGKSAPRSRKRPVEVLTSAEVSALLHQCSASAATGVRNRALISVMYRTGLRVAEALALRPVDVNAERNTIRVLHGKGDKPRTVGIDDGGMAMVARWMDARARLGLRGGPLFCTLAGGPLSDSYVRTMMRRIAAKAGIEKRVHPHGLRHSHAVDMASEGVAIPSIQQQLGHDRPSTTDTYLRGIAAADLAAMARNRPPWNPEDL
jgi:site-specific recombinase XerD